MTANRSGPPPTGVAFLLAQLGAHGSARFAERVSKLDLTPAQAGLIRLVRVNEGMKQSTLAGMLGVTPSKVVALVDDLEARGLVERRRNESDRRAAALHLTDLGTRTMMELGRQATWHDDDLTRGLTDAEKDRLAELLRKVADQQGLTPGVQPGYQG